MRGFVLVFVFLAKSVANTLSRDKENNLASASGSPSKKLASVLLSLPAVNSLSSAAKPLVMKPGQLARINERTPSVQMDDDLAAFFAALDGESDGKTVEAAPGTTLEPPPIVTKVEEPPPAPTTSTTTEFNWNDHTTSSTVPLYMRENREEEWDEKVDRYRQEAQEKKRIELIRNPTTTTYEESWDEKVERYRKEAEAKKLAQQVRDEMAKKGLDEYGNSLTTTTTSRYFDEDGNPRKRTWQEIMAEWETPAELDEDGNPIPKKEFVRVDFKQQLKLKLKMKLKMERKMSPRMMELKRERNLRLKTALKQKIKQNRPIPKSWRVARPGDPGR